MMGRSKQLDTMTEEGKQRELVLAVETNEVVRLTSKAASAYWGDALAELVSEGVLKSEHVESYEGQYSYTKITRARARGCEGQELAGGELIESIAAAQRASVGLPVKDFFRGSET